MSPGRQRAFMLYEMLAALALMTAFALVAARLFSTSMRVMDDAPRAQHQVLAFDSMLQALRADTWSAAEVTLLDERGVALSAGESSTVRWTIDADGTVTRTPDAPAGDGPRVWKGVGQSVRFDAMDAGLLVRVLDRKGNAADAIPLASEVTLLRRAER